MPRIDPLQLLNCLSVLLSPNGGIQSKEEVQRLANLMTKFSKKLVSKCIYILILKNTDRQLISAFMAEGGWALVHFWLQDAMCSTNKPLLKELLELLLITPVDINRLKLNNIPKLVKSLSKREDLDGVCQLANQLVQQWLKIVKEQTNSEIMQQYAIQVPQEGEEVPQEEIQEVEMQSNQDSEEQSCEQANAGVMESEEESVNTKSFYKLSLRHGKQVLSRLAQTSDDSSTNETFHNDDAITSSEESKEKKDTDKKKEKSNHDRNKHKSSSKSNSSNKSSSKDRHRDRDKSSSSSSNSSRDKSDRDKSKDRKSKDKDKHRNNGSIKQSSSSKSSSSSSKDKKENKEKQAEKDKDTLSKIQPQTLQKLGRIPKKSVDDKSKELKREKPSISIEVRKNNEERPKTVKVFNAKMRSTGLEEEAKPPPPRPVKKTPPVIPPVFPPPKRPSPVREAIPPPEKKSKLELPERQGSIKLIPPKPKPAILLESDIFSDALTAACTKKEPKKRKRRLSVTKDSNTTSSPPSSPVVTPTSSPLALKNIAPPKFYQETLETNDEKVDEEKPENNKVNEEREGSTTPTDAPAEEKVEEPKPVYNNGIRSALMHVRRKGPKKSIRWKAESELVEIQYFELDETERVNVTKTFMDMAKMEVSGEREALQMSRKLPNEDLMDIQTPWRILIVLDLPPPLAQPGCKSSEKNIQFAREKTVLQALYFNKRMVPDSPAEPDLENHQMTDPVPIPLEDPENNNETDLRSTPWPEPKGSPPIETNNVPVPPIFQNIQNSFPNFSNLGPPPGFQNQVPPFSAGPGSFIPPNIIGNSGGPGPGPGPEWNINNNQMIPPNIPPPDMINQGPINPNHMYGPGPNGPPGPDGFNPMMNDNGGFPPMQFNQPNMGMFPPNNFMNRSGRGGFRRGGNNGPWVRMGGPGPWNRGGNAPHRGGRLCKNVKNHGFCRHRDTCPFIHPN